MAKYEKVDCHSHYVPPEYWDACQTYGHSNPDGMPRVPTWSVEEHLSFMEKCNVSKSILSITSPGVYLKHGDDALATKIARYVNDYAAELKKQRPEQFGFFASLPLPDVEGSMVELHRVFDELDADGIAVKSSHHGIYPGDPKFDPIFDELNRRHATLFIHPTTPCFLNGDPAFPQTLFPRPMYEFFFETARVVVNLFASGTVRRCPNITFIIPHMGGAFPPLAKRFASCANLFGIPGIDPGLNPAYVKERLNAQFYFDTAGWAFTEQIQGLLQHVTVDRMIYGSDWPWTPLPAVVQLSNEHDEYLKDVFPEEKDRLALCKTNAVRLLANKPIKGRAK